MNDMYRLIAQICLLVGGVTLGLMGLFNFDLITGILGHFLGRIIFVVIGVAAGYQIYLLYLEKMKKS